MLYQEIDKTGNKTIYETDISDFIKSYRANWKRATPAARKAAKEHWVDIYKKRNLSRVILQCRENVGSYRRS